MGLIVFAVAIICRPKSDCNNLKLIRKVYKENTKEMEKFIRKVRKENTKEMKWKIQN